MRMEYTIPKLEAAVKKANETQVAQEERFLYNELNTFDKVYSVFTWLFDSGNDFETKRTKDRYIITIKPKQAE